MGGGNGEVLVKCTKFQLRKMSQFYYTVPVDEMEGLMVSVPSMIKRKRIPPFFLADERYLIRADK